MSEILKKMTGEGLLLVAILGSKGVRKAVDTELDRRTLMGMRPDRRSETYWAGRTFANRHSARMAA